jgi:hypothetical protein
VYSRDYSGIGQVAGAVAGGAAGIAYAVLADDPSTDAPLNLLLAGATIGLFVGWAYGKLRRKEIGS